MARQPTLALRVGALLLGAYLGLLTPGWRIYTHLCTHSQVQQVGVMPVNCTDLGPAHTADHLAHGHGPANLCDPGCCLSGGIDTGLVGAATRLVAYEGPTLQALTAWLPLAALNQHLLYPHWLANSSQLAAPTWRPDWAVTGQPLWLCLRVLRL